MLRCSFPLYFWHIPLYCNALCVADFCNVALTCVAEYLQPCFLHRNFCNAKCVADYFCNAWCVADMRCRYTLFCSDGSNLGMLISRVWGCFEAWNHAQNKVQIQPNKPHWIGTHPPQGGVPTPNPCPMKPTCLTAQESEGSGRGGRVRGGEGSVLN